jgi:hypothetical protein
MEEKFYVRVEGADQDAKKADAIIVFYKSDGKWKDRVISDEDSLLGKIGTSSANYMGYLTEEDLLDYVRKDGHFWSVKKISEEEAINIVDEDE